MSDALNMPFRLPRVGQVSVPCIRHHADGGAVYPDEGVFNSYGFSYDLLSPALLDLRQATVMDNLLDDKEGLAYKALILHRDRGLTMHALNRLNELTTIIFGGEPPSGDSSYADNLGGPSDSEIGSAVGRLLRLANVAQVADYKDVPAAFGSVRVSCRCRDGNTHRHSRVTSHGCERRLLLPP